MNSVIIYLFFFAVYTIILLFWGKSGFKKTNNMRDFCVAGNSLGLWASVFTFTATWFSAVSMQSVTGSVYMFGYSTILYSVVGWFLGGSCLIFVAHKIKEHDILTIPEYFKIRYDSPAFQAFGGFVTVICYILYIIIQIKGFGLVVSELLDIDYKIAILMIYLFVVYTSFGGLFSVSKTDSMNFVVVFLGIAIAVVYIISDIGNFTLMNEKASNLTDGALLDLSSNNLFSPFMILSTSLAWGLGTAANPQYIIRIASAKNRIIGMKMICLSVISMGFLYFGLMIIGIGSRVLQSDISQIGSSDEVLSYFINNSIHSNLSGFIFISIIAAAISTANSQLLLMASSFTYDIYMNMFHKNLSEEKFLGLARVVIFITGTVSLLLSVNPPDSLLLFGSYVWTVFAVTFLCPLYGGLYWKKATCRGAVASSVAGLVSATVFFIIDQNSSLGSIIHPVLPGMIIAFIVFYSVSIATYKTGSIRHEA